MKKNNEKRVLELEQKNKALQREVEELRENLANVSGASDGGVPRIKEDYLWKFNHLEDQVVELKKKLEAQSQLLVQKQKYVEAAKQLQSEIQRIKAQKVQLQWSLKKQSVEFRLCKASLEKEILQLKREGRRNEYKMQKLLALNQGQKMVLQRKTQEASMATKWLKELLESRKSSTHENSSATSANDRFQAMEHEHELSVRLQELYSEYEHQLEERAGVAAEILKLKEEAEILKQKNLRYLLEDVEDDGREKHSEIRDLNEMVIELSGLVRQLKMENAEFIRREKSQGSQTSKSFTGSDNDYLDMDISEAEDSVIKSAEKRNSETGVSGAGSNMLSTSDSEGLKTEIPAENFADVTVQTGTKVCCSCSKKSLCKTLKCKCRASNGSCGTSCGCAPRKCTNRDTNLFKRLENMPQLEMAEGTGICSGTGEIEKKQILASSVALLLHTETADRNDNCAPRGKALSDIGNMLVSKPDPPILIVLENTKALKEPENNATAQDIFCKLPRSAALGSNLLKESKCNQPNELVNKKAVRPATRRSKKV